MSERYIYPLFVWLGSDLVKVGYRHLGASGCSDRLRELIIKNTLQYEKLCSCGESLAVTKSGRVLPRCRRMMREYNDNRKKAMLERKGIPLGPKPKSTLCTLCNKNQRQFFNNSHNTYCHSCRLIKRKEHYKRNRVEILKKSKELRDKRIAKVKVIC